jgi:3D (Asp-Asp-Asp) domain-containing protein
MRILFALLAVALALSLGACSTTRSLPAYERPLAKTEMQQVRTTAYTHSESDHQQYGNRTALGGVLRAAPVPAVPHAQPVGPQRVFRGPATSYQPIAYVSRLQPFQSVGHSEQVYGSAAADWARWPAGTVFRVLSTGQLYRVEDYGWALSGRNTIDLYMATPHEMNSWGVRQELIQVVQWGDPEESLRRLASHTKYRHIRRMVLELEGKQRAAANLD